MSMTLYVETSDLIDVARTLSGHDGEPLCSKVGSALADAASCTGMAGDDPVGLQWASGYASAAVHAAQAAEDVINGVFRISTLLTATAENYARADAASTIGERHAVDGVIMAAPSPTVITLTTRFDDVGGGPSNAPFGWSHVQRYVRIAWPNGHQDRLLHAAAAWHRSANALADHAMDIELADLDALRDDLPEWRDIRTECWSLAGHARDVAGAHRSLARACEQFAHHLDVAHSKLEHEVVVFLAESAAIQAAGNALAFFTAGLSDLAAEAVEGTRVWATVANIVTELAEFANDVREVLSTLPLVTEITTRVSGVLDRLLSVRVVVAEVAGVPGLRVLSIARDGRTVGSGLEAGGDIGADARLTANAASNVENFTDRASIRSAIPAHWGKEVRDFLNSASGKSQDFRMIHYPDGSTQLEHFAPANNAGYGKLFVQVVDKDGQRGCSIQRHPGAQWAHRA